MAEAIRSNGLADMRKTWRNPREVIVTLAQAEPEDAKRRERLVVLLATGLERLLSQNENEVPESLDFKTDISNICIPTDETGTVIS